MCANRHDRPLREAPHDKQLRRSLELGTYTIEVAPGRIRADRGQVFADTVHVV